MYCGERNDIFQSLQLPHNERPMRWISQSGFDFTQMNDSTHPMDTRMTHRDDIDLSQAETQHQAFSKSNS